MKLHLIFIFFFLTVGILAHQSHLKGNTKKKEDPPADTTTAESTATTDTSSAATADSSAVYVNALKDKTWVYANVCPEKKKSIFYSSEK